LFPAFAIPDIKAMETWKPETHLKGDFEMSQIELEGWNITIDVSKYQAVELLELFERFIVSKSIEEELKENKPSNAVKFNNGYIDKVNSSEYYLKTDEGSGEDLSEGDIAGLEKQLRKTFNL
jgi:hypothetical protein